MSAQQLVHGCAEFVQHHATRPFKCFTLNVLASPVPCNRMEGERFACLVQHIREQQYDVVAFQELIKRHFYDRKHSARYESFIEALRSLGYIHDIRGPKNEATLRPLDGGTAIFSKHPFVRCSEHHWQKQASWDAWASKGILHALIDVMPPVASMSLPPVRMHVFTLHAQASHHGWQDTAGAEKYKSVRLLQMQQLSEVIKTEAADGEPVLVLGDFNFDAKQMRELQCHQSELYHGTGRTSLPVDVVAATFGGEHPATYGWRTKEGKLAEPFLTTTENSGNEQSIDHVYFWPKEVAGDSLFDEQHLYATAMSEPRCNLEPCPYDGPSSSDGTRPLHVSDHCGWSVASELTWCLASGLEKAYHLQSASNEPIIDWSKILNAPTTAQDEKELKHKTGEIQTVPLVSKGSKVATYWMLGWLLFFCASRQSLMTAFGR